MPQSPASPAQRDPSGAPLPAAAKRIKRTEHTERMVESAELLQGKGHILIRHEGAIYRLQSTRLGKLILTK